VGDLGQFGRLLIFGGATLVMAGLVLLGLAHLLSGG